MKNHITNTVLLTLTLVGGCDVDSDDEADNSFALDEEPDVAPRGLKGASQLYAASWPSNDTQTSRLISPPIARRAAALSIAVARARLELAKCFAAKTSGALRARKIPRRDFKGASRAGRMVRGPI